MTLIPPIVGFRVSTSPAQSESAKALRTFATPRYAYQRTTRGASAKYVASFAKFDHEPALGAEMSVDNSFIERWMPARSAGNPFALATTLLYSSALSLSLSIEAGTRVIWWETEFEARCANWIFYMCPSWRRRE